MNTLYIYYPINCYHITPEITVLYFYGKLKYSIDKMIPLWVKKIVFSHEYNFSVDFFPEDLEELHFHTYQKLSTVQILNLPKNLKILSFEQVTEKITTNIFPPKLKILGICQKIDKNLLPNETKTYTLYCEFIKNLIEKDAKLMNGLYRKIPENVFVFNEKRKLTCEDLPPNIKGLKLGDKFNYPIDDDVLPLTLEYIEFDSNFYQKIGNALPNSITYLRFRGYLPEDLENHLPKSLRIMDFAEDNFDHGGGYYPFE